MIDRRAINLLYNEQVGKELVEKFYQLLYLYIENKKIEPLEKFLIKMNEFAKKKKQRLVYYDNHCLKEDISQFIVEEYRLLRIDETNLRQK